MRLLVNCILIFSLHLGAEEKESKIKREFHQIGETHVVELNHQKIKVIKAESSEARSLGLMYVPSLPLNEGMLFVFEESQVLSFWMKNTYIDLSVGFFDESGHLLNVHEMKKTGAQNKKRIEDHEIYSSQGKAKYALEMGPGWFKKNKIPKGAVLQVSTEQQKNRP